MLFKNGLVDCPFSENIFCSIHDIGPKTLLYVLNIFQVTQHTLILSQQREGKFHSSDISKHLERALIAR